MPSMDKIVSVRCGVILQFSLALVRLQLEYCPYFWVLRFRKSVDRLEMDGKQQGIAEVQNR